MASTRNPLGDFVLTPHQQRLLFEALNANKAAGSLANNAPHGSLSSFDGSPIQERNGVVPGFQDSPLLDYDYDFGAPDSSIDFSLDDINNTRMIGDLPGGAPSTTKSDSTEADNQDKRSHPDDDDDEENGAKRRESEDKVAKKPGRKPLTTEPSSKRKAQNRAAQRAFRERKERHLKDLETKVQELEKASETVNHENELLRAKVEKMTVELSEYRKRLSLNSSGRSTVQAPPSNTFGQAFVNNINDVNFQFEFPKFGALPGPPSGANGGNNRMSSASTTPNTSKGDSSGQASPQDTRSPTNLSSFNQAGLDKPSKEDLSAGLYNPALASHSSMGSTSRSSFESHFGAGAAGSSSSPSSSSNSNMGGTSSSCGTSPEPFTQSPMGFKPVDTLTTIGEEQPTLANSNQDMGHFANIDINDFNWVPQNNFQFAPQLFNDYREPQDSVLSNVDLDESFFKDAFDMDFTTPYNLPVTLPAKKKDLIAEIDAAKSADLLDSNGQLLTCNKIWEKLQNCPKVQSGDFDLDGLCSDLQKKAKCSGSGAVVDEHDFKNVMKKYLGKSDKELAECGLTAQNTIQEGNALVQA
ncbi:PAP1-domain-containing protein [Phialemonium atrogriseum]|uniref:PAP1-domain-containing protein n=1 Tax=Phialemonium atrogriseum TaxID=1093897 RepID=A0AAJ0CA64_9PEZI|nr:PAP1-domain-containing protein [Phialemonium atrogriseum]KAK1771768.1 PAP1-domain-containing protein [Phialemonium atrogriseum]